MIDNAEVYLNQSWSAVVRRWDCDTEEGFGEGKVKGTGNTSMENEIKGFMDYLAGEKGASKNTQLSYERDINQLKKYLEEKGITDAARVTRTVSNSYVLYLEKEGRAYNDDFQNVGVHKGIFSL